MQELPTSKWFFLSPKQKLRWTSLTLAIMCLGQRRFIVWTILVVFAWQFLPTNCYTRSFKAIVQFVLEKKIFFNCLPYFGIAAIFVMWSIQLIWTIFRSEGLWRLYMKFSYNWFSGFREEAVWNCERTDVGRTTNYKACLYYKLPWNLLFRWAKVQFELSLDRNFYIVHILI